MGRFTPNALAVLLCLVSGTITFGQDAKPTAIVSGVVGDRRTGTSVRNALVTVAYERSQASSSGPPRSVFTDHAGRFVFVGLPGGTILLQANKAGYVSESAAITRIDLASGGRVQDLVLSIDRCATIAGTVTDDLGDAIVDVPIRAYYRSYRAGHPQFSGQADARTDDRGAYRLANLPPGDYVVMVPSPHVSVPLDVISSYSSADTIAKRLALFDISRVTSSPSRLGTPDAQKFGDVALLSLPGAYLPPDPQDTSRSLAYATTYAPSTTQPSAASVITVEPGEVRLGTDLQLTLQPTVTIRGTVVKNNAAVAGAAIRLTLTSPELPDTIESVTAAGLSDTLGHFVLINVPSGEYLLRTSLAGASGEPWWAEASIAVGGTPIQDVRIDLRSPIRLHGRIEYEGGGPDVGELPGLERQNAFVRLQRADGRGENEIFGASIDANGSFTADLEGGRYLFVATSLGPLRLKSAALSGRDASRTPFEVRAGGIEDVLLTFTDRPIRIAGEVKTPLGGLAQSATVMVFPADRTKWRDVGYSPRQLLQTRPTQAGEYSFTGLPPDEYIVVALVDAPTAPTAVDIQGTMADWLNPGFLTAIAKYGVRIRVSDGDVKRADLLVQPIR